MNVFRLIHPVLRFFVMASLAKEHRTTQLLNFSCINTNEKTNTEAQETGLPLQQVVTERWVQQVTVAALGDLAFLDACLSSGGGGAFNTVTE